MAVYYSNEPDEIKACSNISDDLDYNAPKDVVMNVIRKGVDLMAATQRYYRMAIICGDKKERPDGYAEFWVIDRQKDGSYEVANEEGFDGVFVSNLSIAYNIIRRAMKDKVIGDVCLSSASYDGKEKFTTLYSLGLSEVSSKDETAYAKGSGQVRHDAARTIQKAFRHCITDPKHPMTQRRLMKEFTELVS